MFLQELARLRVIAPQGDFALAQSSNCSLSGYQKDFRTSAEMAALARR